MIEQSHHRDASRRYHHGDLKEALVAESRKLISEQGVDAFKIADACRRLGVSTAAPYRHFPDREALLDAVCACAFCELAEELRAARLSQPKGSVESVLAMGRSYMNFVTRDPELFQLMWGSMREPKETLEAHEAGTSCFSELIGAIEDVCAAQGLDGAPTMDIALPLWACVQGLASLKMQNKLKIIENANPDRAIEATVRAIFEGYRRAPGDAQGAAPDRSGDTK